jgi:peptide/nickel transport system substrate-binding protein
VDIKNSTILKTINDFSLTEKFIFYVLSLIFLVTGLGMILMSTEMFFKTAPAYGGSLNEGIIGYPRYINPLLNITEPGRDITSLIYAGLLKQDRDGKLREELAESYTISPDGLTYDVYLKKNIKFHDGKPLLADDVLFTIEKAKDQEIKSSEFINWQGVIASKVNDYQIRFQLRTAYSPFIYNLTLGILPKHIWEKITNDQFSFSSYNYEPIGAGPYKFLELRRDQEGLPLYYELRANNDYVDGKPFIEKLNIRFYKNNNDAINALKNGTINSIGGLSPDNLKNINLSDKEIISTELLRNFAVFINQNQSPILVNKEVRQALDRATDRQKIIDWVLHGYGSKEYSPVPSKILSSTTLGNSGDNEEEKSRIENARQILIDAGWKLNEQGIMEKVIDKATTTLSFTLTTSDNHELTQTAELLKEMWGKIGAKITVKIYDSNALNQTIIRPRKYEALLFGIVVGQDVDLYPFWHSSQRNDPGLNVAMYTNLRADRALENLRNATSTESRQAAFLDFNAEIMKDIPAIFLYSPKYIYIVPKKLSGISNYPMESSHNRFDDFEKLYIQKKKILNI